MNEKHSHPAIIEVTTDIPSTTLQAMYVTMLKICMFEEKVAELLHSGAEIICPVHLYIGEEAVATGVYSALRKDDCVFSTHRSHGHYIAKNDTEVYRENRY